MNEKLDFDTDFLDGAGSSKKNKGTPAALPEKPGEDAPKSDSVKWILGVPVAAVLAIIIVTSLSGGTGTSTGSTGSPPPPIVATVPSPPQKTDDQICAENYGPQSYSTGAKNANGGPVCGCTAGNIWNDSHTVCVAVPAVKTGLETCQDRNGYNATYDSASNTCGCNDGYAFNDSKTACVAVPAAKTQLQICQDRIGYNATYDSVSNTCGCIDGYSLSAISNKCVDALTARDDSCAAKFPGTSYLKADPTDGHPICDCVAGSYFNAGRTACYTLSAFNQSCVNSYGTGSISTTENGKRVCDCAYSYSWNVDRNACITTASINAMCERDVGRNSTYSGTVKDGKYQCSQPY